MRDIPIFTAASGIASLILNQIPYWGKAYVLIRSVFTHTSELMRECEGFCRAAGASEVFFGGEGDFSDCAVYAAIIARQILRKALPVTTAEAVSTSSPDTWVQIYNEKFRTVPAAQYCREATNAFDIIKDGRRIGIGQAAGDQILSLAATERGAGADCLCALAKLCTSDTVRLKCAKENFPAMRLYDRLGFSEGPVKEIWYCKKTLAF